MPVSRQSGSRVVSFSQDNARTARARVNLKLGALAFADARHGRDPQLEEAALIHLRGLAAVYYAQLTGSDEILRCPAARAPIAGGAAGYLIRLQIEALAYACGRHGSDACVELARDALGNLCAAAIALCEALLGADPASPRAVDRALQLDGGE